tara:strand:+ start:428 stop:1252 length:825 start_codon:yes stop_codon:yes gene_type:complete
MTQTLVIEPKKSSGRYWRDIWIYRELFAVLAWRDIAVRYKQTVIGVAWAVIRPLLTMAIFTVLFGRIANLPSDGSAPYVIMVFAGTLPWMMFSTALADGSNTLVSNANLVRKVYFPRILAPVAASTVSLVDFLISLCLLFAAMLILGFLPDWRVVFLPAAIIFAMLAALGPILFLSALSVKYRDFRFIVPFIVQFGLYVSPVGFSTSIVPEEFQLAYHLNPMVGVIDLFRWCLLAGESSLHPAGLGISSAVVIVFLGLGLRTFRQTEKLFADLV